MTLVSIVGQASFHTARPSDPSTIDRSYRPGAGGGVAGGVGAAGAAGAAGGASGAGGEGAGRTASGKAVSVRPAAAGPDGREDGRVDGREAGPVVRASARR
jgi:hypothetical protein